MSARDLERLQIKELLTSAIRTGDGAGTNTGTGIKLQGAVGHGAIAIYHVTGVGGDADETLTPAVYGSNSDDGVSDGNAVWADALRTGDSYGVITQPNGAQIVAYHLKPYRRYRTVDVLAGTTIAFTYGVTIVALAAKAPQTLPAAS